MFTQCMKRYATLIMFGSVFSFSTTGAVGSLRSQYLIETEEVAELIKQSPFNLRLINATWYLPNVQKNAAKEHEEARLTKTTQFFDIDEIAEPGSKLPHTLPSAEVFTEHMKKLRVRKTD